MDTETPETTNAEQANDVTFDVNPDPAADEVVEEETNEGEEEEIVEPKEKSSDVLTKSEGETAAGTEPQTEEEKKAERKARLKKARNQRFTVGENEEEIKDEFVEEMALESGVEEQLEFLDVVQIIQSVHSFGSTQKREEKDLDDESVRSSEHEESDIDDLLHSHFEDDEDEDIDVRAPPKGDAIGAKANFLNSFEVPSLSDISEDIEVEQMQIKRIPTFTLETDVSKIKDPGHFVDPVTGLRISSHSIDSNAPRKKTKINLEEEKSESESESDDSLNFSDDNVLDVEVQPAEEYAVETFVKFHGSYIDEPETIEDPDLALATKLRNEVIQIAQDFLFELFNNVVTKAENVNADDVMRNKMDKVKLHENLIDIKQKYLIAKEMNTYLNSKMCDYYKRMKNFRVFSDLNRVTREKERTRYLQGLEQLDHSKKKAMETKKKNAILMSSVLMDLTHVQNISMDSEEHFEEVMLRTLCTNKSEFLKRFIERELRLMSQKRNEISDTRLYLITRKHTLGRITDKITKLEQINEEICMDDFINIQNQVATLDKKIEERNSELKKLRFNYHTELHLTQHNREKALALISKLKKAKDTLDQMQDKQTHLRECLYQAKLERNRLRKQQSDLSFQGGLLSMPSLMYDFDDTVQKVKAKKADVRELKETFKRVTQRITDLETRCT